MADAVFIIPDGLYLVYRWVTERAVSFNQRALFVLMIFYLVTPFDLLPEVVFGPLGLLDDIPLTVVAFDLLLNRQQSRLVERLWPGDPSVLRRIQQVVKRLNGWVGRGLWKKIKNRFQ